VDSHKISVAKACLEGAESNTMTFPQIIATLVAEGFESYFVDFRRRATTYYLADGDSVELPTHEIDGPVSPSFDPVEIQAAIREAQQLVPGYSYRRFCRKAVSAGCAGYIVSFSGRRVLYFGRTAETHVEHFPN
jgi:uncharacterized protein YbcV (DUF1398 family)